MVFHRRLMLLLWGWETSKVLTDWLARLTGRIDRLSADAGSSLKIFEVLLVLQRDFHYYETFA